MFTNSVLVVVEVLITQCHSLDGATIFQSLFN